MSARTLVGLALILFAQALQCALTTAAPPQLLDKRKPQGPSVLWTTALGYTGEATTAGDTILIGTTNSSSIFPRARDKWTTIIPQHKGAPEGANSMVCLDARTGKLRWRSLHPSVENRRYGIPHHPVTSKPWVDGDRVYYLSVNWEFVCLDLEGFLDKENDGPFKNETLHGKEDADIIWKVDLRKDLGIEPRTAGDVGYVQSSPVGYGDLVYLVTGNGRDYQHGVQAPTAPSFLAVNKSNGKVEWTSNAPGKNIIHMQGGSPVILPESEEVVFPGGDGFLYGFDAKKGKLNWKMDMNALGETSRMYFETQPLVVGDIVVVSMRRGIEGPGNDGAPMMAIRRGEKPTLKWRFGKKLDGFWWHSVATKDAIYTISRPNILHAIDTQTGVQKWSIPVGRAGDDAMGVRIGMAGGFLLCTDSNGELIIVAPGDKPKIIGKYDVDLLIPSYGRATTSKYGICLPLGEGIMMLQIPR